MGNDHAVRRLAEAMQHSGNCGPVDYRPMRNSTGTRAYLTVVVPPAENQ
ncbi:MULTISPECIES: hypothetical protein [Streptomyces]